MSKKYETSFNIFHSECRKSSRFTAKMSNIFILIGIKKLFNFLKNIFFIEIMSFVSPFAHIVILTVGAGSARPKNDAR